ncbi:RING finger and transmembrane domain-containing protein 2 isoform X2 [Girardinichthys multiradiatus]|uniref:RING finger and transmembrane domain-containing protein 2 isoform X2 n=1 Tax=Girardinichthys multiradiatus TaxID=208333 RepID=UPI001FABC7B7|nr:RING finger and transmembrane domain-containing protein 2 isoform X2 [Girardinichthys multiradiatus]
MQRRHSSNTDGMPSERTRSQTLGSESSLDEGGVFDCLKPDSSTSPQQMFSGLVGVPSSSVSSAQLQAAGLVLGSPPEVFIQMTASSREEAGSHRTEGGPFLSRPPHHHHHHHFHHQPLQHRTSSLLQQATTAASSERHSSREEAQDDQTTPAPALSELKAVVSWLQRGFPFILILLAKVCFQHKLGIAVGVGVIGTFAYANSTFKHQVSLREERSVFVALWIILFLGGNIVYIYYAFSHEELHHSLIFAKPNLNSFNFFDLIWVVGITDFVLKYVTIGLKCFVLFLPKIIMAFKSRSFDVCGRISAIRKALVMLCSSQSYGVRASSQLCSEAGDVCAICQGDFKDPVALICQHVFCEECLCVWFDRERTCPLCRSTVIEALRCWKDGTTSAHFQIY